MICGEAGQQEAEGLRKQEAWGGNAGDGRGLLWGPRVPLASARWDQQTPGLPISSPQPVSIGEGGKREVQEAERSQLKSERIRLPRTP